VGVYLSETNQHQLWIPKGFAHGFLVLSKWAEVIYKVTDYYSPIWERCIAWDDPTINIEWPLKDAFPLILSNKDKRGKQLTMADLYK
jgi:dTDP-4-dehydrorhamnose 3,5-epimerase